MDARELEACSRPELIARAEAIGVDNARVLTRTELVDEMLRRSVSDPVERRIARGLLGIARDLVARVVERGLHLPDAAAIIRGTRAKAGASDERPPIATVTLAEIYANQGHRTRALAVLDEVLVNEPDHAAARALRDRVAATPTEEPAPVLGPPPAESPFADVDEPATSSDELAAAAEPAEPAGLPAPIGMLDDAPLPSFYDVDEVVLMPVDPTTVFIYWEVRPSTAAEAKAQAPEGKLVLRILAVTASEAGPQLAMRDVDVPALVGDWVVHDLPVGAVLRAAVGWRRGATFAPVSVAMALSAPAAGPASTQAGDLARFTPAATIDEPTDVGPIALALSRAQARAAADRALSGDSVSWRTLGSS
jgi:hypothetical protein